MGDFQYLYFIHYFALYFVERKKNLEQLNMLITLIHVLSHSTTVLYCTTYWAQFEAMKSAVNGF